MWRMLREQFPSQSRQTARVGFRFSAAETLLAAAARAPPATGGVPGSVCAHCGLRDRGQGMGLGSYTSWLKPWPCLSPAAGHSHSANLAEPASLPVRRGCHGLLCRVGWKGVRCAGLSGGSRSVPGRGCVLPKGNSLGGAVLGCLSQGLSR